MAFTADGAKVVGAFWGTLARLTFPNGRTVLGLQGPVVIAHCVTANRGTTGPARDRLYAFDKITGELVWYSTPGTVPDDSSFSMPVYATIEGHRVGYTGHGCEISQGRHADRKPLWRFQFAKGGVNSQILSYGEDKSSRFTARRTSIRPPKGGQIALGSPPHNSGKPHSPCKRGSVA